VKSIYAGDESTLGRIDADFLKQVVEAIIFASDEPITIKQIGALVEEATPSQVEKIIQNLNLEYTHRQNRRRLPACQPGLVLSLDSKAVSGAEKIPVVAGRA
jgi:hypothetical protein